MMQRYAEYKDSGVDWLGEIPAEWEVKPGMVAFTENKRNNKGMKLDQVLSLSYGNIIIKPKEKLVGLVPESFETYQIIEAGDIVIRGTDLQNDKTSLRTGLAKDEGIITSAYLSLRVRQNYSSRFLHYYLHTLDTTKVIYKFGTGLRQNLSFDDFRRLPVFEIPLSEQTAIAGFLDEKTAKIDELVEIKRRQIAILGERKQILIQNAVTKGLNPDAPMKDSGVDWIGEIPVHWEVKPAKYLFVEVDERSENGNEELLSVSHMTGVTPRSQKTVSMFLAEDYSGSKICKKGDLVFNIMWAWMGALGVSPQVGIVSPSYAVFRQLKSQTFNPVYLEMLMQSLGYIEHYNKVSTGLHSSRLRFYSHMFLSMKIGYPPFGEQERIKKFLTKKMGKISKATSVLENQITKLNEYKTTLINAAVTGKIKVA